MSDKTKYLSVTAIGIALFVVLSLCLQVPVFENYYLCLGYTVMAVFCFSFGTLSGTIVGFFGVILYCLVTSGIRGMPGWALGNVVIGVSIGTVFKLTRKCRKAWVKWALYGIAVVASSAFGILIIKSLVESLLYSQPMLLRMGKNVYAFAADVFVLLISFPICTVLHAQAKKIFPQTAHHRDSPSQKA